MQSRQPRNNPIRQLLFPYGGDQELTRIQGLRVIAIWAVCFGIVMTFCSFPVTIVAGAFTWHRITLLLLISFFSGAFIFGSLACVVVAMSNRAVRIMRTRRATGADTSSGGRYGS